jgi:hypothetical protein
MDINKPLFQLTVGEFLELQKSQMCLPIHEEPSPENEDRYVHGLDGLARLLQCSRSTASRIKQSGRIDKAIRQCGRKIVVDSKEAMRLLNKK